MLKTTLEKEESKKIIYRDYKQCYWESFEKDLINSSFNWDFETYEKNFLKVLNNHTPKKVKVIGGKEKDSSK